MIFTYGGYSHDDGECLVRVSVDAIMDKFMRRMGEQIEYTIIGIKKVNDAGSPEATQAALTAALYALTDAYNVDYQDFGLYQSGGGATRHVVLNDETFGGVKVVKPPTFMNPQWGGRTEYLNSRMYYIVLRAEIRVGEGLYSWDQKLTIKGTGGPKWRYSPREVGDPEAQTLQTATSFWYIQEGTAVGRKEYVAPDDPLFPGIEHGEDRIVVYESPKDIVYDSDPEMFVTSWRYMMEATTSQGFTSHDIPDIGLLT
jgi:hypothetical protein